MFKYIGRIEEKANNNGNLYFEFKLHGNYSLFIETPVSCLLAIESTSPLEVGSPEYVLSDSLKNKECEYVEVKKNKERLKDTRVKESRLKESKLKESGSLEAMRETFINMMVKK